MSDVNLLGKMVRLTELKFDFLKLQPSGSQPVPDSSTLALLPCDQAVRYLCSNSALDSLRGEGGSNGSAKCNGFFDLQVFEDKSVVNCSLVERSQEVIRLLFSII